MKTTMIVKYLSLSLLIFLTGCSPFAVNVQPTIVAQSSTVLPAPTTGHMSTLSSLATETQAAVTETATPPTATQAFVEQPKATSTLAATECQDAAQYITDDGLDGTTYAPNTAFTKTWIIKNTGSCAWDDSYLVSLVSGTDMTQQPASSFIPRDKP